MGGYDQVVQSFVKYRKSSPGKNLSKKNKDLTITNA